jgi:hypothetical protein
MKPIDHLHRLGCPPTNAVRIQVTAITADGGDRRMLFQPGRQRRGRAARQEVHNAMRRQIDQDRAIAMAPPPGPLVDAHGLQSWGLRHGGRQHQPEEGGRTGRQPQVSGEPSPGLPTQGHTDGAQRRHEPLGFPGIRRHEGWQALREDAAFAARVLAHEFAHRQLDVDRARAPGQIGQAALVTAMHRGRGHGAAWAACTTRRCRQLELHDFPLYGDLGQAHVGSW